MVEDDFFSIAFMVSTIYIRLEEVSLQGLEC